MYQYIDTFLIENVSMCRYKYILKVSDTYTVSDTKGLNLFHVRVSRFNFLGGKSRNGGSSESEYKYLTKQFLVECGINL